VEREKDGKEKSKGKETAKLQEGEGLMGQAGVERIFLTI